MLFNRLFEIKLTQASLWVAVMLTVMTLSGCGKKGPLYVPTEQQREQMAKEQAERDAVLKARKQREAQKQQNTESSQENE